MTSNDQENELTNEYAPLCPTCGEKATFRDAAGFYWDSNAHHWRESFNQNEVDQ